MNVLAPVARRLMKLIPRLASNHDGEVVATVEAIRKALDGAGLSFHDLAAVIEPSRYKPRAAVDRVDDFDAMFATIHRHNPPTGKWVEILSSIERQWRVRGRLSTKQANVVRRFHETAVANLNEGVRS